MLLTTGQYILFMVVNNAFGSFGTYKIGFIVLELLKLNYKA